MRQHKYIYCGKLSGANPSVFVQWIAVALGPWSAWLSREVYHIVEVLRMDNVYLELQPRKTVMPSRTFVRKAITSVVRSMKIHLE